jgi:hypothetical protein
MRTAFGLLSFLLALGLSGCGKGVDVDALKASIGMSKVQVEAEFGEPESSHLDASEDHPGGYWVYKTASGAHCMLRFDLPPRVIGADC